jgi:ribonuclease J
MKSNPGFSAVGTSAAPEINTTPRPQGPSRRPERGGGKRGQKSRTFQYQKFGNKRPNQKNALPRQEAPRTGRVPSKIPDVEPGVLRIIPLGGVEQIGQNMTALEYGNDIIVVDVGMQFATADTPGIDYIVPNTKYLEERKDRIRGIFITHGHLDHVGAIPAVITSMGNPPIYTREFGAAIIAKRQEEFPHLPKLQMNIVGPNDTIRAGEAFVIKTFAISHTIPDSMGLFVGTPIGDVALIEDVRVDNMNGIPTAEEVSQYERFHDKKILLLTMDSTSIEKPGWSLSESTVTANVEKIIAATPGRLIIATFASQVERLVAIIEIAERYGRKIVIEGRSMKANIEISQHLGILKTKNIISLEEMASYPPNKILMLVTGAQGEEFAALMRMANKSHRQVQLNKTDTILLSSSIIPGNEGPVGKLKDNLYRTDAKIITYRDSDVHASGHGNREELAWIHRQFNYKYFVPLHGYHYLLKQHAELARSMGTPAENIIVPDNGSIIEIYDGGEKIRVRKEKAPSELVMVDGFAVGNEQEVVVRDRQMLSNDGMFIIVAVVDSKTGQLRKSPDIISRGFVYLKEAQELLREARIIVKRTIETDAHGQNPIDFDIIKSDLGDEIAKFLYQNTAKRPLVIPVILSV